MFRRITYYQSASDAARPVSRALLLIGLCMIALGVIVLLAPKVVAFLLAAVLFTVGGFALAGALAAREMRAGTVRYGRWWPG